MKILNKKYTQDEVLRKGTSNAFTGIIYFVLNTITSFIINPILVNYLGGYYFGIWKSIEKFIGFAGIVDGQGTQALKWTIANQEASEDYEKKKRYIASALIIWLIFLPILFTLISIFMYFSPSILNNINSIDVLLVYSVIFFLGINLIITPLLSIPESLLVGTNQGHRANNIKTIWMLLTAISMYLVVIFEYGLIELSLVIISVTLLRGINYFYISSKRIHWIGMAYPKKSELKSFLKFSSWKLVWAFNARFLLSSEVIFLTIFMNPNIVSEYIFTSYFAVTGILITAIVTSAFNPGIGKLIGNEDYELSRKIIISLREFVFAFSILIGAIVLLLNENFISLWVGEKFYLNSISNLLIVLLMIQLVLIRNEAFLIDLSLDIKKKVLLGLLSIFLSSMFCIFGYTYIDNSIYTIFISLLLGRLILLILFPVITNKMIGHSNNSYQLKKIIIATIILCIAYFIGNINALSTWLEFVFYGAIESLVMLFIIYNVLLGIDNKFAIKLKLKKILKRKK